MATLKDLQPYIDETIELFMEKMRQKDGDIVDLCLWTQLFAFGESSASRQHLLSKAGDIVQTC